MGRPSIALIAEAKEKASSGVYYSPRYGAICPWCGKRAKIARTVPWEENTRLRTELSMAKRALLGGAGGETVPALKAELLAARRNLEAANMRILQLENIAGKSLDIIRLQELAWKFAEGVMTGEVIGVAVEDIRLLRGV